MGDFQLTPEQANEVFSLLVREAGARESQRADFVYHLSNDAPPSEYRFQGNLGFGGKFRNTNGRLYIDCYPEDDTAERRAMISVVNARLSDLVQLLKCGPDAQRDEG